MNALPLLVLATLCLTILPATPSAVAGPPVVNSCSFDAPAGTMAPPCTFVCNKGDRIYVSAQTTATGSQWPALRARCGGAEAFCQSSYSCSGSSPTVATRDDVGTCVAETVSVRGTCTASGAPTDVGSIQREAERQVAQAWNTVQPHYDSVMRQAGSATWWADLLVRSYAEEAQLLGANLPSSCSTVRTNDCQFPCLPGDRIHVRVQGWLGPWLGTVSGTATCGGQSTSCADYMDCHATSPGLAGAAAVGLCSAATEFRATCWSAREGQPSMVEGAVWGAVGTALGVANQGAGIALATADSVSDHDRDTHRAPEEATSNSDPLNAASRPTSDDDGDGIQNKDERSRAHAASALVANAFVRTTASDRVTFHFGHSGARATVRSPEGNVMTITYVATQASAGCPPAVAIGVPDLSPCLAPPVVATFSLAGDHVASRRAFEPATSVPASAFVVSCPPRASGRCLEGVGLDGTWTFVPATQAPRATLQPKAPAGFAAVLGGKTFKDVAADSGDILGTGNGQNTRDGLMPLRLWNWHLQAAGSTYQACSGGVAAPCYLESQPQESVLGSRQYL